MKLKELFNQIMSQKMTFDTFDMFCKKLEILFIKEGLSNEAEICIPLFELLREFLINDMDLKKAEDVFSDIELTFVKNGYIKDMKRGALLELYTELKNL